MRIGKERTFHRAGRPGSGGVGPPTDALATGASLKLANVLQYRPVATVTTR
jgi:hypothetical protein